MSLLFLKSIKLSIIYLTFSQAEKVKGNDRRASRSSLTSHSYTLVRDSLFQTFFFGGRGPNHLANHDMKLIIAMNAQS